MARTKSKAIGSVLLASSVSLSASVYIVPSDIDSFKQKTDQAFFDIYQNDESVIANGINDNLKAYTDSVDTNLKFAEGHTIGKAAQANIGGISLRGGTEGSFVLHGNTYQITVSKEGNPSITGVGARNNDITLNGLNPRGHSVVSVGKYSIIEQRYVDNVYFDLASATLTTTTNTERRVVNTGKYNRSVGAWGNHNLVNISKSKIGVSDLLSNRDITERRLYSVAPDTARGGKYGNA